MAKRKIKSRYDKVPCRSLCEKLPRDLFSDTEWVWTKDAEYPGHKGWSLAPRELWEAVYGLESEEFIPAPTADELLEKFPSVESYKLRIYLQHSPGELWNLNFQNSSWNDAAFAAERNLVSAICKCYLQQYRKEKSKKWK